MDTASAVELIEASLETCAERAGDIAPSVFERVFAADPAAASLMQHTDPYIRGRMLETVLDLLMSDDHLGPDGCLQWELRNHVDADATTLPMYAACFAALTDAVRESLGAACNDESAARQAPTERIMADVRACGE